MCDVKKMFVGLSGNATQLLLHLILNADDNGVVEASERRLADDLKMGRQEIRTAKQVLLQNQRITQETTQGKTTITLCCCGDCVMPKPKKQPKRQPKVQPSEDALFAPEWVAQEYVSLFLDWMEYKRSRREGYKNEKSLRACYNSLVRMANGDPETARLIVEQSMANGWKGLFPVKTNNNGTNWRDNGRDDELAAQAVRMRTQYQAERTGNRGY